MNIKDEENHMYSNEDLNSSINLVGSTPLPTHHTHHSCDSSLPSLSNFISGRNVFDGSSVISFDTTESYEESATSMRSSSKKKPKKRPKQRRANSMMNESLISTDDDSSENSLSIADAMLSMDKEVVVEEVSLEGASDLENSDQFHDSIIDSSNNDSHSHGSDSSRNTNSNHAKGNIKQSTIEGAEEQDKNMLELNQKSSCRNPEESGNTATKSLSNMDSHEGNIDLGQLGKDVEGRQHQRRGSNIAVHQRTFAKRSKNQETTTTSAENVAPCDTMAPRTPKTPRQTLSSNTSPKISSPQRLSNNASPKMPRQRLSSKLSPQKPCHRVSSCVSTKNNQPRTPRTPRRSINDANKKGSSSAATKRTSDRVKRRSGSKERRLSKSDKSKSMRPSSKEEITGIIEISIVSDEMKGGLILSDGNIDKKEDKGLVSNGHIKAVKRERGRSRGASRKQHNKEQQKRRSQSRHRNCSCGAPRHRSHSITTQKDTRRTQSCNPRRGAPERQKRSSSVNANKKLSRTEMMEFIHRSFDDTTAGVVDADFGNRSMNTIARSRTRSKSESRQLFELQLEEERQERKEEEQRRKSLQLQRSPRKSLGPSMKSTAGGESSPKPPRRRGRSLTNRISSEQV